MNFFETVNKRRAVRKFLNQPVPVEVMESSLQAALLAPNSSNMQPWEFYWIRSEEKKSALVKACFSQNAAKTASEIVVAVSRTDTWRRNRKLLVQAMHERGKVPSAVKAYYNKVVPLSYLQDPFGILGVIKGIAMWAIGLFRPTPRNPQFKSDLFETVTKTTALACQNFMLAVVAQGYDSCPMEGFDENRVKKLIGLNRHSRVVMVIGVGKADPTGIFGERIRLPSELFIHHV